MLSVKHFLQLMAIILLLSMMFLYLNINSRMDISVDSVNSELSIGKYTGNSDKKEAVMKPAYYVVFSGGNEMEEAVYENVILFMEQMKLPFTVKKYVMEGELAPGIGLIFCNAKVSEGIPADVLGSFIKQGGKALFASGIPEGYTDAYLSPVWGIMEKGSLKQSREWEILGNFLPAGNMTVAYPEFQASTSVKLSEDVEIYIEDETEGIPIVYKNGYGEGSCLMLNGTFMQNRYSGGIFAAALGALEGELLYPVIGSAVVFLDDFPFILPGYDKNSVGLYGRSMESFQRDVLWPVFISHASGGGIKYTMNLCEKLEAYEENLLNEEILTYLAKDNLRYDGEIMASKYYGEDGRSIKDSMERIFRLHFPNYEIQAFSALSGVPGEERALIERGNYQGNGEDTVSRNFGYDGKRVYFPVMTEGYAFDRISFPYLSGLTLYGVISHSIPVSVLVTAQSEEYGYESVKKDLGSLLGRIGSERGWLQGATVTEAAGRLIACSRLEPAVTYGGDGIKASFGEFVEGQKLLLRTGREIKAVNGAQAYRINESYYCIEAFNSEITIEFAEQEGFT